MRRVAGRANRTDFAPLRVVNVSRTAAWIAAALVLGLTAGFLVGSAGLGPTPDGAAIEGPRAQTPSSYPVFGLLLAVVVGAAAAAVFGAVRGANRATIDAGAAELARMSWRLDFALATSEVGVWDVDLKTGELMWDERAAALFGAPPRTGYYSEADWIGALHPDDRERTVAAANAAVAGDGRFVFDYRVVHPDGEIRHVRDIAAVYRGADGAHRLVGLVWDVTPDFRRQEELELRRAEAEAATIAKSRFLAAMSHEIRTPLTGVLGMLDLMLGEALPDRQRERGAIARASARSLLLILNDILDFSKLEAHRVELLEQAVDPREIVREVVDLMAAGAERKGLSLAWSASHTVPEQIVTDPMRLRQILTNLVSNATKFTESGRVHVRLGYSTSGAGGALEVEVEDTGIGIPPDSLGRLFEEFVQGDSSLSRRRGGTGLGLAISKRLVELMGGRITVRSVPGMGSAFAFALPAPIVAAPAPDHSAPMTHTDPCADGPMRILVAEDNATNQYLIRAYLENCGHVVTTVENGADAVRAVEAGDFDVVLMDVQMPELDGRSATLAIRALPSDAANVAIVALTANALAGDRETYFAAGMDDYISKPIDFNTLRSALRRARAKQRAGKSA